MKALKIILILVLWVAVLLFGTTFLIVHEYNVLGFLFFLAVFGYGFSTASKDSKSSKGDQVPQTQSALSHLKSRNIVPDDFLDAAPHIIGDYYKGKYYS